MSPQGNTRLRKASPYTTHQTVGSMHWLFRTNIPRRRASYLPPDVHKRNFFGMGEILSVLTNPAETVRSLTESKRLLDEARQEIHENREKAQIRPKHTFSKLPGFFPRHAEVRALEKALEGEPAFTVLFGASSVGKTALLREVLSRESYHVLHFDLRIAGFADLPSLYMSLSQQMEQYFEEISKKEPGYKEFEREAWSFKHDRLNVERRLNEAPPDSGIQKVKTSDIARLMELFQSSLLKYWQFEPFEKERKQENRSRKEESDAMSSRTRVNSSANGASSKHKWKLRQFWKRQTPKPRTLPAEDSKTEKEQERPPKRMPVILFDEAHRLPALIQSTAAMNCLLNTFLVLTKQDRLCHVIHATSDPFYHTWLRQLNVMQHCKIITIGDCSKAETRAFFDERILPSVPERLHRGLQFEALYEAFGGKLVHWQDYVTDYVNSNGNLNVKQSSHFLQAHALLNLHIIHSSQSNQPPSEADTTQETPNPNAAVASNSRGGFRVYSAITQPHHPGEDMNDDRCNAMIAGYYASDFTAMQLLKVISRITQPNVNYLPYFMLCREFGVRAVDGMVKGRILDLRWTETVTKENDPLDCQRPMSMRVHGMRRGVDVAAGAGTGEAVEGEGSSATAVNLNAVDSEGSGMVAVSERELILQQQRLEENRMLSGNPYEDVMGVIGPKLVPTTPVMRYAMQEVISEYQEEESISESEYASAASVSDVDEY